MDDRERAADFFLAFPASRRDMVDMKRVILAIAFLLGLHGPATALSEQDNADVKRIHAYLNSLSTLSSRFIQASSRGAIAQGSVFISRPGKMRFEYDPPSPILMIADGFWLIYRDNELEQTSQYPLSKTPLAILVSEVENLEDLVIIDEVDRSGGLIRLSVRQKSDPDMGQVILTFSDQPLSLRQWIIVDAQGTEVKVALLNPQYGAPLDPGLFHYTPPSVEDNANQ